MTMNKELKFPLGHSEVATFFGKKIRGFTPLAGFRLGIVKLQRWLSSREPSCLSVKDLLSTASTAKSAVGRQQQLQPLCYLPCLREQG